jgi:Flp pilus assembly protein TadG
MNLCKNDRGSTMVEFALVALPVLFFIIGIMQTAYIVWIDNILHYSVDAAARCGAVQSTTPPCNGGTLANMQSTANALFAVANAAGSPTFTTNCSGSGLAGSYNVRIGLGVMAVNLTLSAKSCYPTVPVPS